uniref:Golgi SNAP receptor complex member 1 n=1 Tax=Rhinopithecus bieti TaxID=61621 RepID=A0A2K6KVU8_RHIBE
MAAGTSNYWEDLRKQARQLENELDLKLVSFSKLCTSYSHSSTRDGRRDRYRKNYLENISKEILPQTETGFVELLQPNYPFK